MVMTETQAINAIQHALDRYADQWVELQAGLEALEREAGECPAGVDTAEHLRAIRARVAEVRQTFYGMAPGFAQGIKLIAGLAAVTHADVQPQRPC